MPISSQQRKLLPDLQRSRLAFWDPNEQYEFLESISLVAAVGSNPVVRFPDLGKLSPHDFAKYTKILPSVNQYVNHWLRKNGLDVERDQNGEPIITLVWNKSYKCFEINFKIAGEPIESSDKEGRIIKIRCFNQQADTEQTYNDLERRCESLGSTVLDMLVPAAVQPMSNPQFEIAKKEIRLLVKETKKSLRKLDELRPQSSASEEDKIKACSLAKKRIEQLLANLAVKLEEYKNAGLVMRGVTEQEWQAVGSASSGDDVQPTFKKWLKLIQKHEAEFTAKQRREILINIYPGNKEEGAPFVMNMSVPRSDVPSTIRDDRKITANWFEVENAVLDPDSGDVLRVSQSSRSSSRPPIEVADEKMRQQAARDMVAKEMRFRVRDRVIHFLNSSKVLKSLESGQGVPVDLQEQFTTLFNIKTASITLLSPNIKPYKAAFLLNRMGIELPNQLVYANEFRQLTETKAAFEQLGAIRLEKEDLQYIAQHINVGPKKVKVVQQLRKIGLTRPITHQELFHNFSVNALRDGNLTDINAKLRQQTISAVITDFSNLLKPMAMFKDVMSSLEGSQTNLSELNEKTWQDTRKLLLQKLEKLNMATDVDQQKAKRLLRTGFFFISFMDLCIKNKTHHILSRKTERDYWQTNYLESVFLTALTAEFGYLSHTTCKSGEDRTGMKFVLDEQFAVMFGGQSDLKLLQDPVKFKEQMQKFWSSCVNSFKFSSSLEITDMNAPGTRGYQIAANTLPAELTSQVHVNYGKQVTATNKTVFKGGQKIHAAAKARITHSDVKHDLQVARVTELRQGLEQLRSTLKSVGSVPSKSMLSAFRAKHGKSLQTAKTSFRQELAVWKWYNVSKLFAKLDKVDKKSSFDVKPHGLDALVLYKRNGDGELTQQVEIQHQQRQEQSFVNFAFAVIPPASDVIIASLKRAKMLADQTGIYIVEISGSATKAQSALEIFFLAKVMGLQPKTTVALENALLADPTMEFVYEILTAVEAKQLKTWSTEKIALLLDLKQLKTFSSEELQERFSKDLDPVKLREISCRPKTQ